MPFRHIARPVCPPELAGWAASVELGAVGPASARSIAQCTGCAGLRPISTMFRALIWSEAIALASVAKEHYECGSESSLLSPLR